MTSQEAADQMLAGFHAAQAGVPLSEAESAEYREGYALAPKTAAQSLQATFAAMDVAAQSARKNTMYPVPRVRSGDFSAPSEHSTHWGRP